MSLLLEIGKDINLTGGDVYGGMPFPEDISTEDLRELTGTQVIAQRVDETGSPVVIDAHDKISYAPNKDPRKRIAIERVPAATMPPHVGRLSVSACNMIHITPDVPDGESLPTAIFPLSALRYGRYTLRLFQTVEEAEDTAA